MTLRLLLAALGLFLGTTMSQSQAIPGQSLFTRIAAECGQDTSKPSFSKADYAKAMQEATKALKAAKKGGSRAQITAINQSVARMKECLKEEEIKFVVPPMSNCTQFLIGYTAFSARAPVLLNAGKRTQAEVESVREQFRPAAENCMKDIMTKCLNGNSTKQIDFVIEAFAAASDFVKPASFAGLSKVDTMVIVAHPQTRRPQFCEDTDWACSGNPAACKSRIAKIKKVLNSWTKY